MEQAKIIRPTKKQRELLGFIEEFISVHGYSPSYREIMQGLNYNSVATVALHINSLISRGHLHKRDHSARSLEVTNPTRPDKLIVKQLEESEEKWLIDKVETYFKEAEDMPAITDEITEKLQILVDALRVLGPDGATHSFLPRLSELKTRIENKEHYAT